MMYVLTFVVLVVSQELEEKLEQQKQREEIVEVRLSMCTFLRHANITYIALCTWYA